MRRNSAHQPSSVMGLESSIDLADPYLLDLNTPTSPYATLKVFGIPEYGARSRVELQVKIGLSLYVNGMHQAKWSFLRLDESLVVRDSNKDVPKGPRSTPNILDLTAHIFCASDPDKHVQVCSNCIEREKKRILRRRPATKDLEDETENGRLASIEDPNKIFVINTGRYLDFTNGEIMLPTRIKCYCRHHNEKEGFKIRFRLTDHTGVLVAETTTPPIMITDGHKSNRRDEPGVARSVPRPKLSVPYRRPSITTLISTDRPTLANPMDLSLILPEMKREDSYLEYNPYADMHDGLVQDASTWRPSLLKAIPSHGPLQGGTEVTLLGTGFLPGMVCMFGPHTALQTQCWSSTTMVCIIPPSPLVTTVAITIQDYSMDVDTPVFSYTDDTDRSLMELALQIIGVRMNGHLSDARQVAMQIANEAQTPIVRKP